MANEPEGREQPSTAREIQAPSPEVELALHRLSFEGGQAKEPTPDTSENPRPPVQRASTHIDFSSRTLDEAFAEGLNRQWADISSRYEYAADPGENVDLTVNGHSVTATRDDNGFVFTIDGQTQDSPYARDFIERNNLDLSAALREELERREREQESSRRQAEERSRAMQQASVREAVMAQENIEFLRRSQRIYDAQMRGDGYVVRRMNSGEDLER